MLQHSMPRRRTSRPSIPRRFRRQRCKPRRRLPHRDKPHLPPPVALLSPSERVQEIEEGTFPRRLEG